MRSKQRRSVLVVAPHPDDESLGCGGTILKHIRDGDDVHWLIVTGMSESFGYSADRIAAREAEINKAAAKYGFSSVVELGLPPAKLDIFPIGEVIAGIAEAVSHVQPNIVYTVYRNDAHSDHQVVFDAVMASTKSFRYPFVKEVLAYETISETDFGYKPEDGGFRPNLFVDISPHLTEKLEILNIFESEIGEFPFPRSNEAIAALARVRGVQCGAHAAEAFMLIKGIR